MTAVQAITMGSCSESHLQAWALFWFEHSGVLAAADSQLRHHRQEGSAGWWGSTVDSGTAVLFSLRGTLVTDFKLLVACHLRGRHLVGFIKSQPGGIMGIMEADVGQGKLGIPSDHFFQLLRVILAQAGQYVGAVGHFEGAGCVCGCSISQRHRETVLHLELLLAVFSDAISGSKGVAHHGLHWRGFTGVLNTDGFSERHSPYRLVRAAIGEVTHDEVEFCLPYPLDPLLILRGAQREKELTDSNQIKRLCDRAGWDRSDEDGSFTFKSGEEHLFTALSVLERSSKIGRAQIVFFVVFWMLQHLSGILHRPAGSSIFFRKFVADVYVHLARAMSVFFMPFD
jgi:hypothetical protein